MEALWFSLLAFMMIVYVALDGFDLGAGIVHFLVGRNQEERRLILRTIGPVWDGNEVWLVAAGGTLYFSFPVLYASSFSGFYLPLMMVLWLLMLRGGGIELRGHLDNPLWRSFWDVVFSGSSALLALFLGAALGNVIRGVPLDAEGYFFVPLWTTFDVGERPGVLDWYTILTGLVAVAALSAHGAGYVATKTDGDVQERARRVAKGAGWAVVVLMALSLLGTLRVRPDLLSTFAAKPWGLLFPLVAVGGLAWMIAMRARSRDLAAFLGSTVYIVGTLGGAAFGLFPTMLRATTDPRNSLTVYNSAAKEYGLGVGLVWWSIAMALAAVYYTFLYRSFRGKVSLEHGEGY